MSNIFYKFTIEPEEKVSGNIRLPHGRRKYGTVKKSIHTPAQKNAIIRFTLFLIKKCLKIIAVNNQIYQTSIVDSFERLFKIIKGHVSPNARGHVVAPNSPLEKL